MCGSYWIVYSETLFICCSRVDSVRLVDEHILIDYTDTYHNIEFHLSYNLVFDKLSVCQSFYDYSDRASKGKWRKASKREKARIGEIFHEYLVNVCKAREKRER